ncbi:MAG: glycerophosphodiester phosphodiesterase [Methylococcaceae bacterium]|nr:glycerophosphodiester phosphodiesterase [Methylococcaceae bacterium]
MYPHRLFANKNNSDGVMNIAHRGARAFAPENTLAAFAKAKQFGCAMFEIDVHRAKDGELVVHHDDQLTRCTDVSTKFPDRPSYYVSDFTSAELAGLDAGSWYARQLSLPVEQRQWFLQSLTSDEIEEFVSREDLASYASGTIHLPTLKQTLELAQDLDLMVNIELKTLPRMYAGMADAVVDLVEAMTMDHQILISSFDHQQLQDVRQRNQNIATAVLTGDRMVNIGEYLHLLDADAHHPGLDTLGFGGIERKLDAPGIKRVRERGFGVNVWTCNDKNDMRKLITAGVTGLISDFPNRVRDVISEPAVTEI